MNNWEYKTIRLYGKAPGVIKQIEEQLNAHGLDGWELVTIMRTPLEETNYYLAFFKRYVKQ